MSKLKHLVGDTHTDGRTPTEYFICLPSFLSSVRADLIHKAVTPSASVTDCIVLYCRLAASVAAEHTHLQKFACGTRSCYIRTYYKSPPSLIRWYIDITESCVLLS